MTDGTGAYELTGLLPGQQYIVVEVLQDDWFQSDPANDVLDAGLDTSANTETLGEGGYVRITSYNVCYTKLLRW